MKLDNLILQITYPENSTQYSNILTHLLSHSPDFGTMALPDRNMHKVNTYLYDSAGSKITYRRSYAVAQSLLRVNEVINSRTAQELFLERLSEFYDHTAVPILESKHKFMLPASLNYKTFKSAGVSKINADYTGVNYVGLLEYIMYSRDDLLELFNHHTETTTIDFRLNSKISDGFIDLIHSSNFCQTTLEYIAGIRNENIDIDQAMEFFVGKPIALVAMAIDKGVGYVMQHGYQELKSAILSEYKNTVSHRAGVHSVKLKTLLLPDANISRIAYDKLYEKTGLTKNDQGFHQWHAYMFDRESLSDEFSIEFFLNIISKLMTGENFKLKSWNMIQQIVLDSALEEKLGITDGIQALKEYLDRA